MMDFSFYRRSKLNGLILRLQIVTFLAIMGASLLFAPRYFQKAFLAPYFITVLLYTVLFSLLLLFKSKKTKNELYDLGEVASEFLLVTLLIFFTEGHLSPFEIVYLLPVIVATLRFGKKRGLLAATLASILLLLFHFGIIRELIGSHFLTETMIILLMYAMSWFIGDLVDWETQVWQANLELEEEKRQLAQHEATFQERERLAREIHDGLAQDVSYLRLEVKLIRQSFEQGDEKTIRIGLERMGNLLDDAYWDVRNAIHDIRQTAVAGSFSSTVKQYVESFGKNHGINTTFNDETKWNEYRLSSLAELQLLRILKELLSNVRKHSESKSLSVILTQDKNRLIMRVADAGIGFDVDRVRANSGKYGLGFIEERLRLIEGKWQINSEPGRGTEITVNLPLQKQDPVQVNEEEPNA